jgi:O-antigen chain-terminating methyltransferase
MRRIIEELVEKRKRKQSKLKDTIRSLGRLLEHRGFFKTFFNKDKNRISKKLLELNDDLNELVTIQDKEWDAYANNHSTMVFKSLQWKVGKLEAEYSNVKTLLANFITLEQSLDRLITSIDTKTGELQPDRAEISDRLKSIKDRLSVYQYSDFEQRFRGDEQEVKKKLERYLPIFAPVAVEDRILDIGCGRGEFMELLLDRGKRAEGIDLSQSMLQAAQEKGLTCELTDALSYLEKQVAESLGGIFSAQVIEHLEPVYLRELVLQCFRVLKPGAPVILETVNPLSLFALSNIYFLDVTHCKPLHPEFMRYLLESSGFSEVNVIYSEALNEEQLEGINPENRLAREFNSNVDKLNKILYASPVYAVTGIKK